MMPQRLSGNFYQEHHVDVWVLWNPVTKDMIYAMHVDQKQLWATGSRMLSPEAPPSITAMRRMGYRATKARVSLHIGNHHPTEDTP
jgi:hypothetical protein